MSTSNTKIEYLRRPKIITKRKLREIEQRQLAAIKYNNLAQIEDYKGKVIDIIDSKGLDSDDNKVSLDTALKILPFIIPAKKSMEMTVITKKIEDIIQESIEEAQIINSENEEKTRENT